MDTPKQQNSEPTLKVIAGKLMEAQRELDELAVQLALGKAEAREAFEKVKADFRKKVAEFKNLVAETGEKFMTAEMKQKIEALEVQLALGKAEGRQEFEEQKKKLQKAVQHLEGEVKEWLKKVEWNPDIVHEFEKFKLKLEILQLKFSLKKFEIKDDFREGMANTKREIEKVTDRVKEKLQQGKRKYHDFSDEVATAYDHLRNALKKL